MIQEAFDFLREHKDVAFATVSGNRPCLNDGFITTKIADYYSTPWIFRNFTVSINKLKRIMERPYIICHMMQSVDGRVARKASHI